MVSRSTDIAPFVWSPKTPSSWCCDWNGFYLEAFNDGRWLVYSPHRDTCTSWSTQVMGTDIMDARRRAQAAAMVLKSLCEN